MCFRNFQMIEDDFVCFSGLEFCNKKSRITVQCQSPINYYDLKRDWLSHNTVDSLFENIILTTRYQYEGSYYNYSDHHFKTLFLNEHSRRTFP